MPYVSSNINQPTNLNRTPCLATNLTLTSCEALTQAVTAALLLLLQRLAPSALALPLAQGLRQGWREQQRLPQQEQEEHLQRRPQRSLWLQGLLPLSQWRKHRPWHPQQQSQRSLHGTQASHCPGWHTPACGQASGRPHTPARSSACTGSPGTS